MIVLRCDLVGAFSDFASWIWFGFIGNYGPPKPTSPRPGGQLPYRDALYGGWRQNDFVYRYGFLCRLFVLVVLLQI